MNHLGISVVLISILLGLYQAIRSYFLNRDIRQASVKESLLQTVIDAKNIDITKDEADVKEKSDAYEDIKRSTGPKSS